MDSPDNFKEILKRKFSGSEEPVPGRGWDDFKAKYDLKRSRILLYRNLYVAGAVVLIAVVAGLIVLHKSGQDAEHQKQIILDTIQQPKNQPESIGKPTIIASQNTNSANQSEHSGLQLTKKAKTESSLKTPEKSAKTTIAGSDSVVKKPSSFTFTSEQQQKPAQELITAKEPFKTEKPRKDQKPEESIKEETTGISQPENTTGNTDSSEGVYTNIQSDQNGLSTPIAANDNRKLDVVNVITPNGDGINDKLVFKNIDQFGTCIINIYDSRGVKLYSSSNYQNNWDARYQGKIVPEGTYYYVLETMDGKLYKGAVNVLK
jgi:gliding motility-associated-like protein